MTYALEARLNRAFSRCQRTHDDQLPEDDLGFLDTPEGEEFASEEEEALREAGAARVIEFEEFWHALNQRRDFRKIRDEVIAKLIEEPQWAAQAERMHREDMERRNEP